MFGRSPTSSGRRQRRRGQGWSGPSNASSRRQQPPDRSSASQQPSMPQGTEVEVRVDADGFHGSWFEATVEGFLPARGLRSARYTVTYTHLLSDDPGSTLVESFDLSHIRPRPPPLAGKDFHVHEIVEAFHKDGWWSGIVLSTDPLTVAFPITREVVAFRPNLVRPRRDYVDGQWVPAQAVIAVQPKRAVRVYVVGDKVEVLRDRELYGYSWFPGKVLKVIDKLSYIVEYFDLDITEGGEKAIEYLHCLFIRPAMEHSPRESEFRLRPGAAVEVHCDGAWSPGVVMRSVVEGEYEVSIDGKDAKQLLTKVAELLKPQYKWDGKHWRIASSKRQGNRQRSVSRKCPSSPVEVASSDDECNRHDVGSSATKRLRKELPQKESEIELTKVSGHPPESEMDTTLSALRKSLASNQSPKSRYPLSGKNNFQITSRRMVSTYARHIKMPDILHASSELPIHQSELLTDGSGTGEVVNQEILPEVMFSDDQLSTPVSGPSADEATHASLTVGLRNTQRDLSYVNNTTQQTLQMPLSVQTPQLKTYTLKHKGVKLRSIHALQGKDFASDKIQLKGKNSTSMKEIVYALSAPTYSTHSAADKQIKVSDVVSGGTDIGSNITVLTSKKSKLGFKDFSSPRGSTDATCTVQKRGRKRVAERLKESSVERLEKRGPHTQQPLDGNLDAIMDINEGEDHELSPLMPPASELICNRKDSLDEGEVDEGLTQKHLSNAGSSQRITDSNLVTSCPVVCSSAPSTLQSRISAEDLSIKNSPMWHQIEAMEPFQDIPQRPHFLPLKEFGPLLHEGMALGLMVTYASLVQSVKVSHIADSMESFEQKITALDYLEKNGFDVKFLQHSMNKLLQTKCDHTKHCKHLDELKELLPEKESVVSQKHSLLEEKEKTVAELEQKLESLRGEAEQIAKEANARNAEFLRLKADVCKSQEECGNDELRFHNIMLELRSRSRLGD